MDRANNLRVEVGWSRPTELWMLPLTALAQTEKTPMAVYEGTTIMPIFSLELVPKDTQTVNIEFKITEMRG